MSKVALNLFKSNAAIGLLQPDGSVLPSPEFVRAMSMLFERVGGAVNMGVDDLALLASTVTQPDQVARRAAADAVLAPAIDQSALVAALVGKIAALQAQVSQVEGVRAELAKLGRRLDGAEQLATFRDPYRVNWERPGRIGYFKANTGSFTTVNKLILTPPANSATFTLADGKEFTVSNTLTLTATDTATLNIGGGGTLGTAAYRDVATDWAIQKFGCNGKAAQASFALGAAATDLASVIALANNLRTMSINNGTGS